MRLGRQVSLVLMVLACVPAARADEVADNIAKAAAAWQAHDSQGTLNALDAATKAVHQVRADALKQLLPLPLPGWTADPPQTSAVGVEMLGGGTSASRIYHNGSERVDVQITTDSPMLQNMAALLQSPYAQAAGVKAVTVAGHALSYTESDNSYIALVADKIIIKIAGNKDTPEPVVRTFVAAVDFAAAGRLAH